MAANDKFKTHFPGDRATAPSALESDTDSAWTEFERLSARPASDFQGTAPLPPGSPRQAGGATGGVTVDQVMVVARRNNRACPLPDDWAVLCQALPSRKVDGRMLPPPPAFTADAWRTTSSMSKRLRLKEQIEWAEMTGHLQVVFDFLWDLPEDRWHHMA